MKEQLKGMMLAGVILSMTVSATVEAESIEDILMKGKPYGDLRLRYEHVEQDGLMNANSKTARARVGFKTGEWKHLSGVIEGESVFYLGNDDYNDTVNKRTDHATVADPENIQVNQAYGQVTGIDDTVIKAGRQVITMDNHRFIGHVGWRQNNQVFDAVTMTNTALPKTTINYGYIYNVNRIFGEQSTMGDWGSKSNYYNISNTALPIGKLTTYGYFLDFGGDSPANSSKTFGGYISGSQKLSDEFKLSYYGEYAYQTEYGENTTDYGAHYYHLAPAVSFEGLTATIGYEVLGSDDSTASFRTPLATLHKFNGWSDKFLGTPAAGLEDFYIDLTYKVSGLEGDMEMLNGLLAKVQYHDFSSNDGDMDYGSEWGIYVKKPINDYISTGIKYSNYKEDGFGADTQKITVDIDFKY
ncbi:MAG: hypothetical protein KC684_03555 [Candidatus Omnitrophica bacterium]|nr:hypothetical protein [Candidatus Omnitrophota bacterium]